MRPSRLRPSHPLLKAARAERERHGAAAGRKLMQRQAREKCTVRYRDGGPGGNPW
ncbi:hypothetical protein [Streptomyces sp. NPDC127108]|uniref:hypothetical protein n=1 Tax=Streptomyces sp. NPDC127108 TaxID=3345361 RepID=UPI003625D247